MSHETTIPYCTVKGFRRCLALVAAEDRFVDRLDRRFLASRRFPPHAIYPVLGAMRFLGLVAENGRVQPEIRSFLQDDDLPGRRAVIERAYGDVLATIKFPVEDREDVDRLLVDLHGCAPGVAAFCSTLLLWLAAESGFFVASLGRRRRGRPPAHLSQLSGPARSLLEARSAALEAQAGAMSAFAPAQPPSTPASADERPDTDAPLPSEGAG